MYMYVYLYVRMFVCIYVDTYVCVMYICLYFKLECSWMSIFQIRLHLGVQVFTLAKIAKLSALVNQHKYNIKQSKKKDLIIIFN